jgi:hypothetical protein
MATTTVRTRAVRLTAALGVVGVVALSGCSSLPPEVDFMGATTVKVGAGPGGLLTADVNGDEIADLITSDFMANTISVMLGDGQGGVAEPKAFQTGMVPSDIGIGDFNGDKNLDLATSDYGTHTVSVLLGDGKGNFGPFTDYSAGDGVAPNRITIADLNNDEILDVATSDFHKDGISVLLGDGKGAFGEPTHFPVVFDPIRITSADVDDDGNLDVLTANFGSHTIGVMLGDGEGGFTAGDALATGHQPAGLATADFNGDGKLDVASASYGDNTVSVFISNGDGTFKDAREFPVDGTAPSSLIAADLNNDDILDLAIANGISNDVSVLRGDGNGYFSPPAVFPMKGDDPRGGLIAVDLDRDGQLDLVTANHNTNDISLLLNGGAGEPKKKAKKR